MSSADNPVQILPPAKQLRPIHLSPLPTIKVYEVMENDLKAYSESSNEEQVFSALTTFFAGVAVPLVIQWPVGETNATKLGLYYGGTFTCALGFLVCLILTIMWRKKRSRLVEQLYRNPLSTEAHPAQAAPPSALPS